MNPKDITVVVRRRVRKAARDRCGYCLNPQRYVRFAHRRLRLTVMGALEIEHIIPRARGGRNDESNLWLSCSLCNRYKGTQTKGRDPVSGAVVALFNPHTQKWFNHFQWSIDGTHIIGLTQTGRATVEALKLNNEVAVEVRRNWVLAGWHPPEE